MNYLKQISKKINNLIEIIPLIPLLIIIGFFGITVGYALKVVREIEQEGPVEYEQVKKYIEEKNKKENSTEE